MMGSRQETAIRVVRRWSDPDPRGFTLVELLVVILIVGTLLALVIPNLVLMQERARRSAVVNNMHIVRTALEGYAQDHNGSYPDVPYKAGMDNSSFDWGNFSLWFPGGDPFGTDGEPVPGNLPINPYDGKRYNGEGKPVHDLDYESMYGELEAGQHSYLQGADEDCPYLEFGHVPNYLGGIGVASYVPEGGLESPSQYGIYGFGRDPSYPMYTLAPGHRDPRDEDGWVFRVVHN